MHAFAYERVDSPEAAIAAALRLDPHGLPPVQAPGQFIAGGTNMTDYMKLDLMRPQVLIDINPLAAKGLNGIEVSDAGLRLGALVRMSEAEDHPEVKRRYPVIADTLKLAATRQIRNMASLGGNMLQRTRCNYFRESSWPCNKRAPGSGCSALEGVNRQNAVLGVSDQCIAAYPGDFAQALIALDASIETLRRGDARRTIRFADLHRRPGTTPNIETVLEPGELITAITVPAGAWTARSRYVKVRDRQSYAFALASAAVALDLDGETVRDVRIALGGVAAVPWRSHEAEEALRGKPLTEVTATAAALAAFAGARPGKHNAFKVPLGRRTLVRALLETKTLAI